MKINELTESLLSKYEPEKPTRKEKLHESLKVQSEQRLKESIDIGRIKQMLRRLNEGEISPEDKYDSYLLRRVLAKTGKRANAKLTKEEQDVLDKYGLKRRGYGRGEAATYHKDTGIRTGHTWGTNLDKQNLADKARKAPNREYGHHINRKYWGKFQDAERAEQAVAMRKPYNDMEHALNNKKVHQNRLRDIDDEYAKERAELQAKIDRLEDEQTNVKQYHTDGLQYAQDAIDDLLKKSK